MNERESVTRLLLRPKEAADALGIGRSKCYALIASGELPSVRVGASIRVPLAMLEKWIANRASAGADRSAGQD